MSKYLRKVSIHEDSKEQFKRAVSGTKFPEFFFAAWSNDSNPMQGSRNTGDGDHTHATVMETGASRHHGGSIKAPPDTP